MAKNLPELSERYAQMVSSVDDFIQFSNGETISVGCYLVPNDITTLDRFDIENSIVLHYNKDIKELKIESGLYQFGTSGLMILEDDSSRLSFLIEDYNLYHFVIVLRLKLNETKVVKIEPYIMHITSVEPISPPNQKNKRIMVRFADIISYEAGCHQFASLLKFNPAYKETSSYSIAFRTAIEYILDVIKQNTNGRFEYRKQFKFNEQYEGNDKDIIFNTMSTIKPTDSIYTLLQRLTLDACVAIKPNSSITNNFEMVGDIRIPMFCKEECISLLEPYYAKFGGDTSNLHANDEKTSLLLYRPFTFRNFYMPFNLAFDNNIIFEAFNADQNSSSYITNTMNGNWETPITAVDVLPTNAKHVSNRWKNMIFISSGSDGAKNRLVFFNWLYEFFNQAFLGGNLNTQKDKFSNIIPPFYSVEKSRNSNDYVNTLQSLLGGNQKKMSDDEFKLFSEKNSNIFLIKNEHGDMVTQMLAEMGKTIASFVFLNTMYEITTRGNLFRRPNEIINICKGDEKHEETNVSLFTDYKISDHIYLYVTKVSHYFHGLDFDDIVTCNRIYERGSQGV